MKYRKIDEFINRQNILVAKLEKKLSSKCDIEYEEYLQCPTYLENPSRQRIPGSTIKYTCGPQRIHVIITIHRAIGKKEQWIIRDILKRWHEIKANQIFYHVNPNNITNNK
ncbi:MAG: hypothetical protein PHP54_01510 [Clostridia bacterium]|nr:hypothetical protein [Clostridia bacterium]